MCVKIKLLLYLLKIIDTQCTVKPVLIFKTTFNHLIAAFLKEIHLIDGWSN